MSILQFLLTFSILSILGSLSIYGFYTASRGQWETTPDGQFKKTGMILKYWSLFWEQYRSKKMVFYGGVSLANKVSLLRQVHPSIENKLIQKVNHLWLRPGFSLPDNERELIEKTLLVRMTQTFDQVDFYTEIPVYDWPEWVQKPLSSCPTCMAGPYGTIIWMFFHIVSRGTFCWTSRPILCEIGFAMLFLLTLACINSILHKLLKF